MKYTRISFGIAACLAVMALAACNDTPTHARDCTSPSVCGANANGGVLGGGGGRTDTIPQPSSMGDSTGVLGGGGGH